MSNEVSTTKKLKPIPPFPVQEDTYTKYEGMCHTPTGSYAVFISYDKKTNQMVSHPPEVLAWINETENPQYE